MGERSVFSCLSENFSYSIGMDKGIKIGDFLCL